MQSAVALSEEIFVPAQENPADKAKTAIDEVMEAGHPLMIGWSGGKDSTTVLNLALTVARERLAEGKTLPPIIVTHADTLVENPEVARHVKSDMCRIEQYATQHGLPLQLKVAEPSLNDQLMIKIIGGRCLPVFANKSTRDCTIDLKIKPQTKLKKAVLKSLEGQEQAPVTVIGTRFDESASRKSRMETRGETGQGLWSSPDGELMLSPVADWTDCDVWEYLSACSRGEISAYSDFTDLIRLYRDGSDAREGEQIYSCRFGCHVCTVGRDKSLESMLRKGKRYHYMAGLNQLQRFLVNTQYDLDRRQWVGRSINENGYIAIRPDVYSPAMLEELLQYCLTIDVREKEAAMKLGIEPRFELISAQALIAIDAMWSLQGLHPAHHALKLFQDIYNDGKRYEIPEVPAGQPVKIPEPRYLHVGLGWAKEGSEYAYSGLQDATLEAVSEEGDGCMGIRQLKNGATVLDVNTAPAFAVDLDAAHFIVGYELDYLLSTYGDENRARNSAYRYYATTGCLQLAKGSQAAQVDLIMRRTSFKESNGLTVGPGFDLEKILARTVSKKDMQERHRAPHIHIQEPAVPEIHQYAFGWA